MRRTVEKLMAQYGTDVKVSQGAETQDLRAFFQAVHSRNWQNMESVALPLGETSRGQYTYIGPAAVVVQEGDCLLVGEKEYMFRRVEPYHYGGEIVYRWGLCVEKGGEDTWGA